MISMFSNIYWSDWQQESHILKPLHIHNTAECDEMSDLELTRAITSISSGGPDFWHVDLDRLSISEESSEIKELDQSSDDMEASQATCVHDDVSPNADQGPTGDDVPQALSKQLHSGIIFTLCADRIIHKLIIFSTVVWSSGSCQIAV